MVQLKRSITLPFLVLYGLGTMVGGGFYALLGKVAGQAGMYAPVSLLLTGALALIVCFAFAELSSRFPVSAGESRYVAEGFNLRWLAILTGWLVILTGVVSAAALAVATIGFLQELFAVPLHLGIALLVCAMVAVAAWGIGESVGVVTLITIIEIGALVYAVGVADVAIGDVAGRWREFVPPLDPLAWTGVFSGAFLAFYAFIGFEDMVNIAEEVKGVRRTLPLAIIISVVITVALYIVVAAVAVTAVTPAALSTANAPIAAIVGQQGWYASTGLVIVSLLTGLNGALVQLIMASRVAYGLADRGQAPAWLGKLHPRTQTPLVATAAVGGAILVLALFFPLTALAEVTSTIILVIFALINVALWRIKRRNPDLDGEGPRYPLWLPILGAVACSSVLLFRGWVWYSG